MSNPGSLAPRSALGHLPGSSVKPLVDRPDLRVEEEALLPVWSLRLGRTRDHAVVKDFASTCGLTLPSAPGTVSGDLAWVEPRCWWILGDDATLRVQRSQLPEGVYLTELTARFCVVRVSGPSAATLLSSSVSLAVSEPAFPAGSCARVKFAEFGGVYLQRIGADFRLAIDVGLGHCLAAWLHDAASQVQAPGPMALPATH